MTDVAVAPDLKTAKAYISVLGDQEKLDATIAGLTKAEGYIRSCLAKSVNLRNTPKITFIADTSIAYGVEMTRKIEEVASQIPDRSGEEAESGGFGPEDEE